MCIKQLSLPEGICDGVGPFNAVEGRDRNDQTFDYRVRPAYLRYRRQPEWPIRVLGQVISRTFLEELERLHFIGVHKGTRGPGIQLEDPSVWIISLASAATGRATQTRWLGFYAHELAIWEHRQVECANYHRI